MIGFALVDLGYMDGAFLHGETFKKEKWCVISSETLKIFLLRCL